MVWWWVVFGAFWWEWVVVAVFSVFVLCAWWVGVDLLVSCSVCLGLSMIGFKFLAYFEVVFIYVLILCG